MRVGRVRGRVRVGVGVGLGIGLGLGLGFGSECGGLFGLQGFDEGQHDVRTSNLALRDLAVANLLRGGEALEGKVELGVNGEVLEELQDGQDRRFSFKWFALIEGGKQGGVGVETLHEAVAEVGELTLNGELGNEPEGESGWRGEEEGR